MAELGTILRGESRNGKMLLTAAERARLTWALNLCPGPIEIVIRKPSKDRSGNQNKYYWGVVLKLIADSTGDSTSSVHSQLKKQFLGPGLSTSKLSTKQFDDYIERIRAWAGVEYNIIIPDPERVDID